jgi:hypothetical protein
MKLLLCGILGGAVMFLWGAFFHEGVRLHYRNVSTIPGEESVMATLQGLMKEPGLYFFPWEDHFKGEEGLKKWEEKYASGPHGMLVYHPRGGEISMSRMMVIEFLRDVLCALIAGYLLCKASASLPAYGSRVLFVTLFGVLVWLAFSVAEWNWYEFPTGWMMADFLEQVGKFGLTGIVLARIMKP